MAVPLNLKDIQSGFLSASTFNENNTLTEEALAKTLNRTSNAVDNAMEVDFDMGLNNIFNVASAILGHQAVPLDQVNSLLQGVSDGSIAILREPKITATAGQTVFNLSSFTYIPGSNTLSVYINGVKQYAGEDFAETDSSTITTDEGLAEGDEVVIYLNQVV